MDLPSVIQVRDEDGTVHWTSPYSELAKKYAPKDEEVPDATVDASPSDDRDAGTPDGGSGERQRAPRPPRSAARSAGETESESGS